MKFWNTLVASTTILHCAGAVAVPHTDNGELDPRVEPVSQYDERTTAEELWKRKGGGGGGKGGGGGGGPKGGGGGTPKGGGSNGGGGGTPKGSPSSNSGGQTTTGSGPRPNYGPGGNYYAGGATVPFKSGTPTRGGISPLFIPAAGIGFLGAAYLYGAYSYPYYHQYPYYNRTSQQNETKPVECVCSANEVCGCEDNGDQAYFRSIIGDGSYDNLNKSVVNVYDNTTDGQNVSTIMILGSLPNGTTAEGGDEDPNAAGGIHALLQAAGWWPLATSVLAFTLLA